MCFLSEGDYTDAKALIESYKVTFNQILLKRVRDRFAKLNTAPYKGFIQPQLKAVANGEEIKDVTVTYPDNFLQYQLELSKKYSFLPASH